MTAATRADAQRDAALRRANAVRTRRAQIKQDLRAGRRTIDRLLAAPPAEIATMTVHDLLICVPRYGHVKAGALLSRTGLSPTRTIAALSERQRDELRRRLRPARPGAEHPFPARRHVRR